MDPSALPKDPVILLSFINARLRDYYSSLDDLCQSMDVQKESIVSTLSAIDYEYDASRNQFL